MLLWQGYALSIEFRRVRCPEGLSTVGLFAISSANATIGVWIWDGSHKITIGNGGLL
jgi:hypothetical protein